MKVIFGALGHNEAKDRNLMKEEREKRIKENINVRLLRFLASLRWWKE